MRIKLTASNTKNEPELTNSRRHDLDALRGAAMLLGILLHGALAYMEIPWIVQDRFQSPGFGTLVSAIHGFRMPLFFLLSGYFTAMLWQRKGVRGLLVHRWKRIVLPLLLGCITVIPLMWVVVIGLEIDKVVRGANDDAQAVDSGMWQSAADGDLESIRRYIEDGGAVDARDSTFGMSPLGWTVLGDQPEVARYLLEAGADPSFRDTNNGTVLHLAAFFGRATIAQDLIDHGADLNALNAHNEKPIDSLKYGRTITNFIAGLLKIEIDFESVTKGREVIRPMLGGSSGEQASGEAPKDEILSLILLALMAFPFFHHLWFLWFLCWLVVGFSVVAAMTRRVPTIPFARYFISTPLCLFWLVPLTMLLQSFMQPGGVQLAFGPDTSVGLIPIPRVLTYYAIFFGFGALMFCSSCKQNWYLRYWWVMLLIAIGSFAGVVLMPSDADSGIAFLQDEGTHKLVSVFGQVLYAWMMIFGLMGLFESCLSGERPRLRYLSDSSYWLYLIHLPLILIGQAMLRNAQISPVLKLIILVSVCTSILLISYHIAIRYTWVGNLLNGKRVRPVRQDVGSDAAESSH